jgi:aryl sulfotransferase
MGLSGPDRQSDVSAESYFDTHRSYWKCRQDSSMLMVHYNELKMDLDGQMRRIAKFLDIETPTALWPELVKAATFESMQQEGGSLMPFAANSWEGGHAGFIFAGQNERWRSMLTQEDISLFRDRAASELEPDLAQWLQKGGATVNSCA